MLEWGPWYGGCKFCRRRKCTCGFCPHHSWHYDPNRKNRDQTLAHWAMYTVKGGTCFESAGGFCGTYATWNRE